MLVIWLNIHWERKYGEYLLGSVGHDARSSGINFYFLDPMGSSAPRVVETWSQSRYPSKQSCRNQTSHRIAKAHPAGDY